VIPTDQGLPLARDAINQALKNDPGYAPAYARAAVLAGALEGELAAAAQYLELGLALDPVNLDLIGSAVKITRRLGRLDQSIALAEYAAARDPVSVAGHENLANAYFLAGRLDEALDEFRKALTLSPESGILREEIGETLLLKGDTQAALAEFQQEPEDSWRLLGLSMAYQALGRKAESDASLDELIGKYAQTMSYPIAYALAYRGEVDRAFEWLDKAVKYRDPALGLIAVHQMLNSLHSDPRWLPFLRRIGMAPEQLAAIKFDVMLPN
jgi:tetratricopeptide (TPR) repeat protein